MSKNPVSSSSFTSIFLFFFLATFGREKGTGSEAPHLPDGGTDESIFLTEMFSMSRV
jgi:hypothetical protein